MKSAPSNCQGNSGGGAFIAEVEISDLWGILLPVVQCPIDARPVFALSCPVLAP